MALQLPKGLIKPGEAHWQIEARFDDRALEPCPSKLYQVQAGGKVKLIREWKVLCQGVAGPSYKVPNGDTVEGIGILGRPIHSQVSEGPKIWASYGPRFIPMQGVPGYPDPQAAVGRAGIGAHAGGSILGIHWADVQLPRDKWTLCLAPFQQLVATQGCCRNHTFDIFWLSDFVEALMAKNLRCFWSVDQE